MAQGLEERTGSGQLAGLRTALAELVGNDPVLLWNLVLLCRHHHGIIEPSHDPTTDRWKARIRTDGIPQITPPRRVDAAQRPRGDRRPRNAG
jgi:hypothetical protein